MIYGRSEVFMAVNVKIMVFWDVIDNLVDRYQHFGGTCLYQTVHASRPEFISDLFCTVSKAIF
jgi:hypothetical protein